MHTLGWIAVILLPSKVYIVYRMWAGGMFETGLERLIGFTKAHGKNV